MLKKILFVCFSIFFSSSVFAQEWDLQGVDIVTRAEWGAEESMRRSDHPWYTRWQENNASYDAWLQNGGPTGNADFEQRKRERERYDIANKRLMKFYPTYIDVQSHALDTRGYTLDYIVERESEIDMRRPRMYTDTKELIAIQYTGGPHAESLAAGKEIMQNLAVEHSFSKGWGDIGYHFLIDSAGNIYEGRAGGEGVIGSHMKWNDTRSLGIGLMGADEKALTQEMKDALLTLTSTLSWKYEVSPYEPAFIFYEDTIDPYIYVESQESVFVSCYGSDVGCDSGDLRRYVEVLKAQVATLLSYFENSGEVDFDAIERISQKIVGYSADDILELDLPGVVGELIDCEITDEMIEIVSCGGDAQGGQIRLKRIGYGASGRTSMTIRSDGGVTIYDVVLVWQKDINQLARYRKYVYEKVYGVSSTQLQTKKIDAPLDISALDEHLEQKVSVLLYEPSTLFTQWEYLCEQGCRVKTDNDVFVSAYEIDVIAYDDRMEIVVDGVFSSSTSMAIENNGIVELKNYARTSATGVARNRFRGDIVMQRERMRDVSSGRKDAWTVVNHLSVEEYLKGVAGASDQDHEEKVKALYLAAKNYVVHYLSGENTHPFVPLQASYTMVDDGRIMLKYVGYGAEMTFTKRYEAIRQLSDVRVTYSDQVIILPYFECSQGFTRSGNEYFGWVDTPRLQSVLDVSDCESYAKFQGHGVGMSLDGVGRLAEAGVLYDEILRWYYVGIQVD